MPSAASSACAFSTITPHVSAYACGLVAPLPARRTRACRARPRTGSRGRCVRRARSSSASSSSAGTTRLTRPHSSAVAASIMSPVNSISSARLRPIDRETGTIGVEQNRPMFTPGVAKRASVGRDGEIARGDELAAGGRRDPVHLGDHRLRDLVQPLHQRRRRSRTARRRTPRARRRTISARSCPAEKAGPFPASTTTRAVGSPATASSASIIARMTSSERAFRRSGRSSTSRTIGRRGRSARVRSAERPARMPRPRA